MKDSNTFFSKQLRKRGKEATCYVLVIAIVVEWYTTFPNNLSFKTLYKKMEGKEFKGVLATSLFDIAELLKFWL